MTAKSLEEIYGSSPELSTKSVEPAQAEPLPMEQPAPVQQEEDKGDPAVLETSEPGKSAPPALDDDLPKDVAGIRAAVQDERRKRREYEAKVADYEKRVADHDRQLAEERRQRQEWEQNARALYERDQRWQELQRQAQRPDPVLDPEAAMQYQQQQTQQQFAQQLAQRDHAIYETRVEISQAMMRAQHPDYDDVEAIFADEMSRNQALAAQLQAQTLPAKFAYEVGKRIKLNREMGDDPDAFIQRKIAEALAAQQAQALQAPPAPLFPVVPTAPRPASPQSLARVTSAAPRSQPAFAGPPPLEEIYK